jgi:hypothetical protein
MSPDPEQRARTSAELRANVRLLDVPLDGLARQLGMSVAQLESTIALDANSRPEDVWRLRDHVERAVRVTGQTPVPFSVLHDDVRPEAQRWFPDLL